MDFKVTHLQGGIRKFDGTGVYVDYLIFYSPAFKRTWKRKWKEGGLKGDLKFKGEIIYNFDCNDAECVIKEVKDGIAEAKLEEVLFIHALCD